MTRDEALSALRSGLLSVGFVAVDDLSESQDGEIFLRAHLGAEETDDTPLTHVNFTPAEFGTTDPEALHRMIAARLALAVQSSRERMGAAGRAAAAKQAEAERQAELLKRQGQQAAAAAAADELTLEKARAIVATHEGK